MAATHSLNSIRSDRPVLRIGGHHTQFWDRGTPYAILREDRRIGDRGTPYGDRGTPYGIGGHHTQLTASRGPQGVSIDPISATQRATSPGTAPSSHAIVTRKTAMFGVYSGGKAHFCRM